MQIENPSNYNETTDKNRITIPDEIPDEASAELTYQEAEEKENIIGETKVELNQFINSPDIVSVRVTKIISDAYIASNNISFDYAKLQQLTTYILNDKIGSQDDNEMEYLYSSLMTIDNHIPWATYTDAFQQDIHIQTQDNPFAWKLKYIVEHKDKDINTRLQEIEQQEILLKQESNNTKEKKAPKKTFSIRNLKRYPYASRGNMTYCSKTAQLNAKEFQINLPNGNAIEAVAKKPIDENHYIGSIKPNNSKYINRQELIKSTFSQNSNFIDLAMTGSPSPAGQKYGHRAVAYLDNKNNHRYVLDPYYNHKSTNPIPLEEYRKRDNIVQANFYDSPIQIA